MQKIYTKIVGHFDSEGNIVLDTEEFMCYDGIVDQCCGPTAAQTSIQQSQSSFYTTATQQAGQVFGSDSSVFQNLQSTFQPTIAAGPSQEGFSAGELSNLNSSAVTQGGVAARNAEQAAGESIAAEGGGNNSGVSSGTNAGVKANIDVSAADNTASTLANIKTADYAQGNADYNAATAGLAGATSTFNSATSSSNSATGAGNAAANTANTIAQQEDSTWNAAIGALGGVAGDVATGGLSSLLGGGSGGGGDSGPIYAAQGFSPSSGGGLAGGTYGQTLNQLIS